MKEKYKKDTISRNKTPLLVACIVFLAIACVLKIYSDRTGKNLDLYMILSLGAMFYCALFPVWTSVFTADDNAVTFGRVFRKKIPYSSIRSIDIQTEKRTYRRNRHDYSYVAEIITFHCEDGDHSFAGMIEPSRKSLTYVQGSTGVSAEDKANSAFSRLKYFIESKRYL
ncbi:hypothetical protein [Ruminococcus albus]|uniref:Putative lipoprotein n=1 Tax=Ruminococcus albus 8 TaxID=246199 RepID=E9SA05_RUMAL|nr:hypothetical protein [Ruminococcus albus]EGC03907.1 putative lipoprotein [Ruminococcus albus 8]MCC3350515.1 hypothetical protein [Ruminococcus albus 8]